MKAPLLFLLCILPVCKLQSATVQVTSPTREEVTTMLATATLSWTYNYESGDLGFGHEITVAAAGSGQSYTAQHDDWVPGERVTISYTGAGAGNLITSTGSTTVTVQPTVDFNAILVMISDRSIVFPTEFRNGFYNDLPLGNMHADDNNTYEDDVEYRLITGVDSSTDLTVFGDMYRGQFGSGSESRITVTGLYVVPEPSSVLLLGLSIVVLVLRRKRHVHVPAYVEPPACCLRLQETCPSGQVFFF